MEAHAAVRVVTAPGGRTVLSELRSQPPLTLRAGLDGVQLVGSSAGPLQGDRLHLDVEVGAGATLRVGSVAAMLVQPGVIDEPSRLAIDVTVGPGASLVWDPQPMVLVRGCDHEGTTRLALAPGAEVVWREEVVFGRHHEPSGSARQRLIADLDGVALVRNDLLAGPRWPGSLGPAGTGAGARVAGTVLVVGERLVERLAVADAAPDTDRHTELHPAPFEPDLRVRLACLPLSGPAVLVTAVSASVPALRSALDAVVARLAPSGPPAPAGVLRRGTAPGAARSGPAG